MTTACDPGGPRGIATAVRDAIDAGLVVGPRFAAAGRQITTQQGIGDTLPAPLGDLPTAFGVVVRSHDDIVQEIRNEVKEGVDLVKIAGSGPGTEEHGAFTRAELDVAVAEAHRLGKPIAIHAPQPRRGGRRRRRRLRLDHAHVPFMDAATLDVLLERDIPIVPAMTLLVNSLEAGVGVMPPATLDAIKRELDAAVAILAKAHQQGATIVAGSESGFAMTPYGEWHTRELELYVELLGMDDHEALLCMTRNGGRAMPRHGGDIGVLAPGKLADVLVVDGEPDRDVRVLADRTRLRTIVKGGAVVTFPPRPDTTAARLRTHSDVHQPDVPSRGPQAMSERVFERANIGHGPRLHWCTGTRLDVSRCVRVRQ